MRLQQEAIELLTSFSPASSRKQLETARFAAYMWGRECAELAFYNDAATPFSRDDVRWYYQFGVRRLHRSRKIPAGTAHWWRDRCPEELKRDTRVRSFLDGWRDGMGSMRQLIVCRDASRRMDDNWRSDDPQVGWMLGLQHDVFVRCCPYGMFYSNTWRVHVIPLANLLSNETDLELASVMARHYGMRDASRARRRPAGGIRPQLYVSKHLGQLHRRGKICDDTFSFWQELAACSRVPFQADPRVANYLSGWLTIWGESKE
jgi:hypothetical protein